MKRFLLIVLLCLGSMLSMNLVYAQTTITTTLEITDFIPSSEESVLPNSKLVVFFNRPIVPLSTSADNTNQPNPLTILPALEGTGRWVNTSIYEFTPAIALASGTQYSVLISTDAITAVDGSQLSADFVATFNTAPAQVIDARTALGSTRLQPLGTDVQLFFNVPMERTSTESAFYLRGNNGENVAGAFEWNEDSTRLTFTPNDLLELDSVYRYGVIDQAQPLAGGTVQSGENEFLTVGLPELIETSPANNEVLTYQAGGFLLYFASPMNIDTLADRISIEPAPSIEPEYYYDTWGYSYNVTFPMEAGVDYTVTIAPGMQDIYGNAIQRGTTFSFLNGDKFPFLELNVPFGGVGFYNAYNETTSLYLSYVNVNNTEFSLSRLALPNVMDVLLGSNYFSPADDYIISQGDETIRTWSIENPAERNEARYQLLDLGAVVNNNTTCTGALPSRVQVGDIVNIVATDSVRLRTEPATGEVVDNLFAGSTVEIVAGPECVNDLLWWQVPLRAGGQAWLAESVDSEYLIEPQNLAETEVNVSDETGRALPAGMYLLEATGNGDGIEFSQRQIAVIATTNLTMKVGQDSVVVWATDVQTGLPVANALIDLYNETLQVVATANTDENGLATFNIPQIESFERFASVLDDNGLFGISVIYWDSGISSYQFDIFNSGGWYFKTAYLYTDRPIYRPDQTVFISGTVRNKTEMRYTPYTGESISVEITNAMGDTIYNEPVILNEYGTFSIDLPLPSDATPGFYNIAVYDNSSGELDYLNALSFNVAEYRVPEFEVDIMPMATDVVSGDAVVVNVSTRYFFGGAVTDANVNYFVSSETTSFSLSDAFYNFTNDDYDYEYRYVTDGTSQSDENGMVEISIPSELRNTNQNATYTIEASVIDETGQTITGRTQVTIRRGLIEIGARASNYVGAVGSPMTLEFITTDWVGNAVANQALSVDIYQVNWNSVQEQDATGATTFTWNREEVPVLEDASITSTANGTVTLDVTPSASGSYIAKATGVDSAGNTVTSTTYFWVTGNDYASWQQDNSNRIDLIADKTEYNIGDTARILIASPFQGEAQALITVERGNVLRSELVTLTSNSFIYELPITEEDAPNVFVSAFIVKAIDENNPVAAFRMGIVELGVETTRKVMNLEITTDADSSTPGAVVTYTVSATDYAGNPVSNAQVGVTIADQAVLSLAPDNTTPLLDFYYSKQALSVSTNTILTLNVDQVTQTILDTIKGGGGGGGGGDGLIEVRNEFVDTPFWNPSLITDTNGQVSFDVTLPDNLTTWQMTARAISLAEDGNLLVGQETLDLVSTKPLIVRPVTPRFFVEGDVVSLGAVVNNNTDSDLNTTVTLAVTGVELLNGELEQTVNVPAQGRAVVSWDVRVSEVENVSATFTGVAGELSDSTISRFSQDILGTLPVFDYEAPETIATSGVVPSDSPVSEEILLPESNNGTFTVELNTSLAGVILNTLEVQDRESFDCVECEVGKLISNVVAYRALTNSGALNDAESIAYTTQINEAIQLLSRTQQSDNGWSWVANSESDVYTTAWALFGLTLAEENGFNVPTSMIAQAQNYLKQPRISQGNFDSDELAFIYYVLARSGSPLIGETTVLFDEYQTLSVTGQAFLAQALFIINPEDTARIDPLVDAIFSASTLSGTGTRWEDDSTNYWFSNTRTTAVALYTLVILRPDADILPSVVRYLVAERRFSRWSSVQDTAWSILALTEFMIATDELNPDYSFNGTLNDTEIFNGTASGQGVIQTQEVVAPVTSMNIGASNILELSRTEGTGNLYYTATLNANIPMDQVQELANGIFVTRQYLNPEDGTPITTAQVGDLIQVRVSVVVPSSASQVIIQDPFPAGTEGIDPSLLSGQTIGTQPALNNEDPLQRGWGWWYFNDIRFYDEKVVVSAYFLPAGSYEFVYSLRATVAGTYNVIPASAYEFNFPEVFGRSNGAVFTITPQ
jgi:alpha-2-macroglobulin